MDKVTLSDKAGAMLLASSKSELKAGVVTFDVTNNASSSMQHEMLVIKLTADQIANPDSLPYNKEEMKVFEDKVQDFGEVSELDPGQSGSLTVNLTPGKYMLLCNIATHYKGNMYALVTVN